MKPASASQADLFEGVGVAFVGVDEHVDGEEEAAYGAAAVGVYEELGDGDGAAGGEGGADFASSFFAAGFAFAVEDVAEGGDDVAGAEVGGEEIAFDEGETVGEIEAGGDFWWWG